MNILKPLETEIPVKRTEINYDRETNFDNTNYNKGLPDRDILRIFITGLWKNSQEQALGINIVQPINNANLFMYKHVFSKFVVPDSGTSSVTLNFTYDGALPDVSYDLVNPAPFTPLPNLIDKKAFYPSDIDDSFIQVKVIGSGSNAPLYIPPITHKGLLLDGCHIMAMMKVRYYLKRDVRLLSKMGSSVKNTLNSNSTSNSVAEKSLSPIAAKLFNVLFAKDFGDLDLEQMTTTDPISSDRKIIHNFLDPDVVFKYTDSQIEVNSKLEAIKAFWKFHTNAFTLNERNISNKRLEEVFDRISSVLNEIIQGFTHAIYKKFGGAAGDEITTNTLIIGDGSDTKGLLDVRNRGVSLFTYDYVITSGDLNVSSGVKNEIDLPAAEGSNRVVHLDIFAIDSSDTFWIYVAALQGGSTLGTYKLSRLGAEVGMRPFVTGVIGIGPNIWTASSGNIIGYFTPETSDLVITDPNVDSVDIIFSTPDNINGANAIINTFVLGAAELVLTVSSFREMPAKSLSLELDASDLFSNDRFEVSTASKKSLFWPISDGPGRQNVQELIALIKSGLYTLNVEMTGNGVGMLRYPPMFDPNITYATGEYYMDDNKVYIFNGSTGVLSTIQDSTLYDYNALIPTIIFHSNKMYRLKTTHTSSVGATPVSNPNWEEIASIYTINSSYSSGDRVIYGNVVYEAISDISSAANRAYDPKQWKKLSRVEQDPRYQPFSKLAISGTVGSGEEQDTPYKGEDLTAPTTGTLESNLYSLLRYSFLSVKVDTLTNTITFIVDSFASPLVSRLDKRLLGPNLDGIPDANTDYNSATNGTRKGNLDQHTAFGRNGDSLSDMEIPGINVAYYNQVLTALRCFGVLEAVVCRIKFLSGNDATVVASLDGLLTNNTTKVRTTNVYDGSGNATSNYEELWYDAGSGATSQNQFVYYRWYTSATEQTTVYGNSCSD